MAVRKLNLVMSYPIEWSLYKVMNNFIQNFYDAVGQDNFMDKFRYTFEDDTIILSSDVGFSKEWLFFIGTSTKRKGRKVYAGKFGEGFKIAALTAYRDMGLGIQMESRDWRLRVTEADAVIDKVPVKVLAYDVEKRPFEENAILILSNAKPEHFKEVKNQIKHFFYEGNPRFGKCIAKGDTYVIYHSISGPEDKKNYGSLFINYQRRDSFELPIIVCNHNYAIQGDDRDRDTLSLYDSNEAIREVFRQVSLDQALELLDICKPRWNDTYDRKYPRRNWYGMISILANKVYQNPSAREEFEKKYADSLLTKGFRYYVGKHERKMAMEWYRKSEFCKSRQIVCDIFAMFNIPTIYELCKANKGFDEEAEMNEVQKKYLAILQEIAWNFFSELFFYEELPECRIILNNKSPLLGKAHCVKSDKLLFSTAGLKVVDKIKVIYMKEEILKKDNFSEALVVYLHELLHQFGGDCSTQFKNALLMMNKLLLKNMDTIREYEDKWRTVD